METCKTYAILAQPLNLANSPSLHLLTPAEQTLCSQLRILPKPYLVVKETLVREYARRGGKLRRREARDLVKIDVNKTSRIWDFLVQAGFLKITNDTNNVSASTTSGSQDTTFVQSSTTQNVLTTICLISVAFTLQPLMVPPPNPLAFRSSLPLPQSLLPPVSMARCIAHPNRYLNLRGLLEAQHKRIHISSRTLTFAHD